MPAQAPRSSPQPDSALLEALRARSDAACLLESGDIRGAIERAERSVAVLEEAAGPEHRTLCGSLAMLAAAVREAGDYERAESLERRALRIRSAALPEGHPDVAALQDALANTLAARGAFEEAADLGRKALAAREAALGADHPLVAESLSTLGTLAFELNEVADAVSLAERALAVAAKTWAADSLPYQWFATRLARAEARRGDYPRAERLLQQSLRVRETRAAPESRDLADSISGLAFLHLQERDNIAATAETRRALELERAIYGDDHPRIARLEANLGLLAYRRRDHAEAKVHYGRALSILQESVGASHYFAVRIHNNLGLVYWKEGDYPNARQQYERALALAEASFGAGSAQLAPALANLGVLTKESGDYDAAERYYKRSVALTEANVGPNHPQMVQPLESLGILYRDRGDYALAEPYFLRVRAISETALGSDHPEVARHFDNLYHLYAAWGDPARSLQALERRLAIDERNLPLQLAVGSERQKLAAFEPFFGGGIDDAVWFDLQHGVALPRARDLAVTTLLRRKGRVLDILANGRAALRDRAGDADRARLDALSDVTARLAGLVLDGPRGASPAEHRRQIESLAAERDAIEAELSDRVAAWVARDETVTLDAVRRRIPSGATLLELAVYRPFSPKAAVESDALYGSPRYAAYVIPPAGDVHALDLGPADAIDAMVDAFRRALRNPKRGDVRDAGRALDARVMQPLRALLGDRGRLLISPDGQLHLIPFEALVDERGRFLVERFEISYLNSGRDLLRMADPRPSRGPALVVADPLFGDPVRLAAVGAAPARPATALRGITTDQDLANVYFAPLAGTAHEARSIKALFPESEVLTRAGATEEAIRRAAAPRILHVATHGFLLGDRVATGDVAPRENGPGPAIESPLLRSGLALTGANLRGGGTGDGILTALEASSLDLWGTELVTLSACDTGVGEVRNGDGVYGLRRAFFMAGAETLMMSLWPVSDYVTRQMMTAYYAGLKNGLPRSEALRRAQLAMLARDGRRHPFYWASFIQLGKWDRLTPHSSK